jgi:hypothetical protein
MSTCVGLTTTIIGKEFWLELTTFTRFTNIQWMCKDVVKKRTYV